MMVTRRLQKYTTFLLLCTLTSIMVLGASLLTEAGATTVYSYIDDQGTPVLTDTPETIPEKYRARVKTHERPDPVSKPPSATQSMQESIKEQIKNLDFKMPSIGGDISGFSPAQSQILTYAGIIALGLLIMMYLSKSQLVRMLGFCLLILVAVAAPVLMYVSDGGPMDTMRKKATGAGQTQQDRLQQIPR